ncbi:MAG: hypothetical protein HUU06_11550, partial [Planctomycetaceae bacterium]|nr:hypothetical protein [Planctomycetaceae bacterium]
MHEGRRRTAEGGWTILEVLLVLLFLGLLLSISVPNLLSARQRNDEAAAVRSLRELVAVQEMIRAASVVDEDRDGKGEYAFLEEICGERHPRSFASRDGGTAPVPLPQFRHKLLEDGEAEVCGYRFRLWLPGPGGTAAGGGKGEGAG